MLKRFMSWLLHRLQKLLSPLGKGKRHAPSKDTVEADQSDQSIASVAPSAGFAESEPASSLGSASLPPQPATGSENGLSADAKTSQAKDAVAVYEPVTVTLNTSTSASELIASGALNYLLEVPETDQLPEIHDLLPAIEPEASAEVKPEALAHDLSEPAAEGATDCFDDEPEVLLEETVADAEGDLSEQAVLFSFEIVESEPTEETPSDISASEELVDSEETLVETASPGLLTTALTDETPDVEGSDSFESANSVENTEDVIETVLTPAAQPAEIGGTTEKPDKAMSENLGEEPVKQGIVKLLFTLKQGNYHGYVEPDDGTKDILFHQKYINADIFDRLERGARVVAAVKYIEGKAYATRVDLL